MVEAHRQALITLGVTLGVTLSVAGHDCNAAGLHDAGWPSTHALPEKAGWSWSAGNHRFSILVTQEDMEAAAAGNVRAQNHWRRHDSHPSSKNAFIVDSRTHLRVPCSRRDGVGLHAGFNASFSFDAVSGPGTYHLYYMPFSTCEYTSGSCKFGANSVYEIRNDSNAGGGCTAADNHDVATSEVNLDNIVYQSRNAFDSFAPMEMACSPQEVGALEAQSLPIGAMLITEDRSRPVRMFQNLPSRWCASSFTPLHEFHGKARPGEFYALQVVVFAATAAVNITGISFNGNLVARCMNSRAKIIGVATHATPSELSH